MLSVMKHQILSPTAREIICRGGQKYQEALAELRRSKSPRRGSSVEQWLGKWDRKWRSTTATRPNGVSGRMKRLQFSQDINVLQASQISEGRGTMSRKRYI